MRKNIVIIGQGAIGRAIRHLLEKTKHNVRIECWDVDESVCPARKPLSDIVPEADILFMCIPSWTIRNAAKDLKHLIGRKTIIVSVSKGLDRVSGMTVDELLKEVFSFTQPTVLLSGPMLADEIMQDKPAAAVVASKRKSTRMEIVRLFEKTKLHVEPCPDMRGAALCGILKNIYAIGFGMAQAMHPGDNYRGLFMKTTLNEMAQIVTKLKGKKETVYTYAGVGDLVATGFSKHSKNHAYGTELATAGDVTFQSEGSVSLPAMHKMIGPLSKKLILFGTIYSIVKKKKDPKKILEI